MSLSTFGSGDPDLFINVGDASLPTKKNHDISSATERSEVVEIDLSHPFIKSKKLKTLKNTYIIAVYGNRNSTYTLSITQEEHPMMIL